MPVSGFVTPSSHASLLISLILSRTACWSAMYSPGSPSKIQPSEALDTSVSSMGRDASFSVSHAEDAIKEFFLVPSTAPPSTIMGRYTSSCSLVSVPASAFVFSASMPLPSVSAESVWAFSGSSSGAISFSSAVTSAAASSGAASFSSAVTSAAAFSDPSACAASPSSAAASAAFSDSSSGTSTSSSTAASAPALESLSSSSSTVSSDSRLSSGSCPPSSSTALPSAANACRLTGMQDEKATIAESSNAENCLCLMSLPPFYYSSYIQNYIPFRREACNLLVESNSFVLFFYQLFSPKPRSYRYSSRKETSPSFTSTFGTLTGSVPDGTDWLKAVQIATATFRLKGPFPSSSWALP